MDPCNSLFLGHYSVIAQNNFGTAQNEAIIKVDDRISSFSQTDQREGRNDYSYYNREQHLYSRKEVITREKLMSTNTASVSQHLDIRKAPLKRSGSAIIYSSTLQREIKNPIEQQQIEFVFGLPNTRRLVENEVSFIL